MLSRGLTIKEAAERWVSGFNEIPTSIFYELLNSKNQGEDWEELTKPDVGNTVYIDCINMDGEVVSVREPSSSDDDFLYEVELDNGNTIFVTEENIEIQHDSIFPCWGSMWSFDDPCDRYWFEEHGGIKVMSELGFRIYNFYEYGYYFGIDSGGHDFYERYWIPLYKERGMKWHDPATENSYFVMSDERRAFLFENVVKVLDDECPDNETTREKLVECGLTQDEINFLGYGVI